MGTRNIVKSAIFIGVVFIALIAFGTLRTSGPSEATIAADKQPATTTTTEPPPEGIVIVRINNASFRPSNLSIDTAEIQIVRWVNEDDVEYLLESTTGEFEVTLAPGDEFEFDYSTLEPGIHRYRATVGFNRIPGSVDTRPDQ